MPLLSQPLLKISKHKPFIYSALIAWSSYQIIDAFIFQLPPLLPSALIFLTLLFNIKFLITTTKPTARSAKTNSLRLILVVIFSFFLVTPFLQSLLFGNELDFYNRTTFSFLATIGFTAMASLLVGILLQRERVALSYLPLFLLIALSIIIFYNTDDGLTINWITRSEALNTKDYISHLSIDLPVVTLAAILFCSSKSYGIYISYFFSLYVLFAIGGRGSFYGFALTAPLYLFIAREKKYAYMLAFTIAFVTLLVFTNSNFTTDSFFVERMLFSDGLSADASVLARQELYDYAIKGLVYQALFGNVNSILDTTGSFGGYIHNYLSTWQIYGSIFFFLVLYLIIKISKYILKLQSANYDSITRTGIFFFFMSVFGLIFSKYIGYPLFWLAVGFWVARISTPNRSPATF